MGACYSIWLLAKLKTGTEDKIAETLNNKIMRADSENVDYAVKKLYPKFKFPYTLEQLMEIFFVQHQGMFDMTIKDGQISIKSAFDASYGWEMVMIDAVEEILPYLEDKSEICIDIDEGYDRFVVEHGKMVSKRKYWKGGTI